MSVIYIYIINLFQIEHRKLFFLIILKYYDNYFAEIEGINNTFRPEW